MRFFFKRKDGGQRSNVTGFWLCEGKRSFSIALLRFSDGARDCYHSHAFNCWSLVFTGDLVEDKLGLGWGSSADKHTYTRFNWLSGLFKTSRDNLHRVHSEGTTWVLTFRGPWHDTWFELRGSKLVKLTHGRKELTTQEVYQ